MTAVRAMAWRGARSGCAAMSSGESEKRSGVISNKRYPFTAMKTHSTSAPRKTIVVFNACCGFGGGASEAQKLKIMKDARLGVYGVLALVFSVGLRAGALATFATPEAAALALVAAASLSRGVLPASMHFLPAVRKTGLAHKAGRPDQESWVTALALGGLFAFLFLGPDRKSVV